MDSCDENKDINVGIADMYFKINLAQILHYFSLKTKRCGKIILPINKPILNSQSNMESVLEQYKKDSMIIFFR